MNKQISELEALIMNTVWELKQCSIRDVSNKFKPKKKLAYTTVATVLQRLYEKGLVKKEEEGSVLLYSPKISKKTYGERIASIFTNNFFNTFGDVAVASFAESIEKLPKSRKKYLLKLISSKK